MCFRISSGAPGLLMGVRLQLVLLTGMGVFVCFMQCLYSMIMYEVNAMCLPVDLCIFGTQHPVGSFISSLVMLGL